MNEEKKITFEQACDIAYNYFKDKGTGISGINSATDIGDSYVINGGYIDVVLFGPQPIAVNKKDGSISSFNLPNEEHFRLLENGTKMEIDEKYIIFNTNQGKYIESISNLLQIPVVKAKNKNKRFHHDNASYYYDSNRGGKSIIVGDDGTYLLSNSSAISSEQLLKEFRAGKRNGKIEL